MRYELGVAASRHCEERSNPVIQLGAIEDICQGIVLLRCVQWGSR